MQADKLREILARPAHAHLEGAHLSTPHADCVLCDAIKERAAIAEASEGLRADAMFGRAIRGLLENARREEWGNRYFAARVIEAEAAALSGAVTQGEG